MRVNIAGLRETVRTLEKAGVEVSDLRAAFKKAGDNVVKHSQPRTNPMTGRLARSVRASNTKNKSIIRAGGAGIPYARVQHYGGYNNIKGKHYLVGPAFEQRAETLRIIDQEIKTLIKGLGL